MTTYGPDAIARSYAAMREAMAAGLPLERVYAASQAALEEPKRKPAPEVARRKARKRSTS